MKLGHVAISVSSLKRSIAFYSKHFGLQCVERYHIKAAGLTIALLKRGEICLELFEFKKQRGLPAYRRDLDTDLRTIGVKHFSLEISNIEKFHKQLKQCRVPFATEMRVFGNGRRYFFVRDPDGILIEIMEV